MVDKKLLLKMKAKFEEGPDSASIADIPLLFNFAKQLIADNPELREDYLEEKIDAQIILSDFDNKAFWIKINDADFDFGEGKIEDPSFTLTADMRSMARIIFGEQDPTSAYMAGEITVEGNLQDALAFNDFLEIGLEQFEEMLADMD